MIAVVRPGFLVWIHHTTTQVPEALSLPVGQTMDPEMFGRLLEVTSPGGAQFQCN